MIIKIRTSSSDYAILQLQYSIEKNEQKNKENHWLVKISFVTIRTTKVFRAHKKVYGETKDEWDK